MDKKSKKNIAIIGAGIAGMAAAVRLSAAGHSVSVFESNAYTGGKLSEFWQGAYRFDAGPSLFTMPQMVLDLLKLANMDSHAFPYEKLEKCCNYFYEDGVRFSSFHDLQKFSEEISLKLHTDPKPVMAYLENAKFKYEVCSPLFLQSSLHKGKTYLSKTALKGVLAMPKLNLFQTMHQQNLADLKEPHLVQYFNRFATYNGSNPYEAPAILNMIPHLEHGIGSYFPKNGMYQITKSIQQAAEKLGVKFYLNSRIDKIEIDHEKVSGIWLNQNFLPFDTVVSNMDILPTYRRLLPQVKAPQKLLEQEKSSSAIIFYWGIKKSFPELHLHNIFFSQNYEAEFNSIFKQKNLYHDPTVYLNISSKLNPTDAPPHSENWFVMVNVPPNTGQDWEPLIAQCKQHVVAKLNRMLGVNLHDIIENESILDPRSIEQKTSSFGGSLYGNASNNRYAAFLRHANFSSRVRGLFFCGGSVHPGGGIPLCLSSGKLVAEMIA